MSLCAAGVNTPSNHGRLHFGCPGDIRILGGSSAPIFIANIDLTCFITFNANGFEYDHRNIP
jgi:hypothetical protein